eukprot:4595541-Amphidinium_carterae.1
MHLKCRKNSKQRVDVLADRHEDWIVWSAWQDGDARMGGGEGEYKTATVFPAGKPTSRTFSNGVMCPNTLGEDHCCSLASLLVWGEVVPVMLERLSCCARLKLQGSAMNLLKMLTFYRKGPFEVKAEYAEPALLKAGVCLPAHRCDQVRRRDQMFASTFTVLAGLSGALSDLATDIQLHKNNKSLHEALGSSSKL